VYLDRRSMARKSYPAEGVSVSFDPVRCIHVRECVTGLPDVFNPGKRPWIQPENSDPKSVTEVVLRCPSGALRFEREDGVLETPPAENTVSLVVDGPLYASGDIEIRNMEDETLYRETRPALCRCGASGAALPATSRSATTPTWRPASATTALSARTTSAPRKPPTVTL
jgi:uncharacterized Fe-S cluster protein YjdI